MTSVYDFSASTLAGEELSLRQFEGQVLLIVNTASACAFTPQYAELELLYKTYSQRGFSVLGFPCNQFGKQERGSAKEIEAFCSKTFALTFPVFAKIDVNGVHAHPLFAYLKNEKTGWFGSRAIKWNFTKFMIDRHGKVVARYAPVTKPEALGKVIEQLL